MASDRIGNLVKVFWEDGMVVGYGYDIDEFQTVRSPFESLDLADVGSDSDSESPRGFDFKSHTIERTGDLQRAINLASNISAPVISLGSVEHTTDFFSKVKCNAKNMATVMRCTFTLPVETYDHDFPPELTDEAREILRKRGQDGFFSDYGQHFIAGRIRQSSFYAFYTHSAETSQMLDAFKSKLAGRISSETTGSVGIEALAKYNEATKSSEVHTECQLYITAVDQPIDSQMSQTDVVQSLKRFMEHHKFAPHVALLYHYSIAIPSVSRPKKFQSISSDLWSVYEQVLIAGIRARSHSLLEAQKLAQDISKISNELSKIHLADPTWKVHLGACKDQLAIKESKLDLCDSRLELLKHMREQPACEEPAWPKSKLNYRRPANAGLQAGSFGPLDSEILQHEETWTWEETSSIVSALTEAYQTRHLRHEYSDRTIVGARLIGHRHDTSLGLGLNGDWSLVEGAIGQSYLEVKCAGSHFRSGGYTLTVWTVPWALYAEDPEEKVKVMENTKGAARDSEAE